MFKKNVLSLALLAFFFSASAAHAGTENSNVADSGNFAPTCSLTNPNIALGAIDLSMYVDATQGAALAFTRLPAMLPIVCNSADVPWSLYTATGDGEPLTIGAETGNLACLLKGDLDPGIGRQCSAAASGTQSKISGIGSEDKAVLLAVWHPGTVGDPTNKPFRGYGAISSTIPVTLEF